MDSKNECTPKKVYEAPKMIVVDMDQAPLLCCSDCGYGDDVNTDENLLID